MRPRDEEIQKRGRALVELVVHRLPQEFEVTGDDDAWPAVGVGLLSRMTTTLGSILDLQFAEREADAGTLLRSLYEHAVHFAWLAAEPSAQRMRAWREHDELMRVRADLDARERGVELSDADVGELKGRLAALRGKELPALPILAEDSDKQWAARIGLGEQTEPTSFRGMYALLFRHYSGVAHPTRRGLNRVVDEIGPSRRLIRLEARYEGNGPYGLATVVFGAAVFVAAHRLGWPTTDEIEDVFMRFPAELGHAAAASQAPPASVDLVWQVAQKRMEAQSGRLARLDSKTTPLLAFGVALVTFFQASRAHLGSEASMWGSALAAVGLLATLGVMYPRSFRYAPDLPAFITDAGWQPSELKARYLGNLRTAARRNDAAFDLKMLWFKAAVWIYVLALVLGAVATIGAMADKATDRPKPAAEASEPAPYEPPPDRVGGTGVEKHGAAGSSKIVVEYDPKGRNG